MRTTPRINASCNSLSSAFLIFMDDIQFFQQYAAQCNAQQLAAIRETQGPSLLLAVPGSGKTTVIIARVGYLMHCAGVNPAHILTLTYTTAAAREMRARFLEQFQISHTHAPYFGTINAFCLGILQRRRQRCGIAYPTLQPETSGIVRRLYQSLLHTYPADPTVKALTQAIGYAKNMMLDEAGIEAMHVPETGDFPAIYRAYIALMQHNCWMDFDDQLVLAYQTLQNHPDILSSLREQYRYICVDEAQDTSLLQHRILALLAAPDGNIMMVGDEDQSIYGFRAAYPRALLDFKETYPSAKILYMDMNYRSAGELVVFADRFIRRNKERYDKHMRAAVQEEARISVSALPDIRQQYETIVHTAMQDAQAGKRIAILYRNNESALPLLDAFAQRNIAVWAKEETASFFTHHIPADMIAFLKFAQDTRDIDCYEKLYYKLNPVVNKGIFEWICRHMRRHGCDVYAAMLLCPEMQYRTRQIEEAAEMMAAIADMPPARMLEDMLYSMGYQDFLNKRSREGYMAEALTQKHTIMRALAMRHNSVESYLEALRALYARKNEKDMPAHSHAITLSTMHSSKGLEFDKVVVIDALEGILPQADAAQSALNGAYAELEEEARLFYVAVTRAKRELEFVTVRTLFGAPAQESRFITEFLHGLPAASPPAASPPAAPPQINHRLRTGTGTRRSKPAADLSGCIPGCSVRHASFGEGVVLTLEGAGQTAIATIRFANYATPKKLALSYCAQQHSLEILSE